MTPAELRAAALVDVNQLHATREYRPVPYGTVVDAVIAVTLAEVIAVMRQRHYPKPFAHRTLECMEQHWSYSDAGGEHPESCYRDGELCNGCGTEACHELPAILALVAP